MACDICGEEKEEWEMFHYWSGLTICKIHSKGYQEKMKQIEVQKR